jgi:hypothetical protein
VFALLVIYYLLPLDRTSIGVAIAMLVVGLAALVGLVVFQVRSIIKAADPTLKSIGALATSAPIFLLLFAATYFVLGKISASNFTEPSDAYGRAVLHRDRVRNRWIWRHRR